VAETVEAAREEESLVRRRESRRTAADVPILPGFYPDPTVCRVESDYYLVLSTFEYFPGAPIFHSQDLLTWSQLGNVLNRRTQFRLGDSRPSTGIYGSTLRHHAGRFWLATTNISDFASGQLIVHADDPAGQWTEPVFVPGAVGIDPDLCWDDSGQCYLTWKAMSLTFEEHGIRQAPLDLATGELTRPSYPVWQGSGLDAAEAPHLYRIEDYWYLLLAEGGTERGHCVTAARARTPWGPFESCPNNPVFTHRSTAHPVQNVGHADLVQNTDGEWAAVYLGVRPRGSTPGFHVLGRETFLAWVNWTDGWPVFDEARFDAPETATGFVDDFAATRLDLRWVVPGGEPENVAVRHPSGGRELRCLSDGSPGLLCARVRDFAWTADATFSGSGRFLLRLDDRHWYGLTFQDGQVRAAVRIGDIERDLGAVAVANSTVVLRIQSRQPWSAPVPLGNGGPDEVVLSVDDGEGFRELARLDGRYLSTEVASGYTGRMLALGSTAARAHVSAFEYVPQ
jgi:Glycosyl hydrolases family 43